MEPYQIAIMFSDNSGQVVIPEFACDTAQGFKSVDMTADESLEGLAISDLQIHLSAVALDKTEGIKFARCCVIDDGTKMAPVDFESFAGRYSFKILMPPS
jgi:hypothetical protein